MATETFNYETGEVAVTLKAPEELEYPVVDIRTLPGAIQTVARRIQQIQDEREETE